MALNRKSILGSDYGNDGKRAVRDAAMPFDPLPDDAGTKHSRAPQQALDRPGRGHGRDSDGHAQPMVKGSRQTDYKAVHTARGMGTGRSSDPKGGREDFGRTGNAKPGDWSAGGSDSARDTSRAKPRGGDGLLDNRQMGRRS